jgi:hypothetical protein
VHGGGDRDRPRTSRPGGDDRFERVDVAQLIAEGDDAARPVALEQPFDRLALAPGARRTEVDDRPAAVMGEAVIAQPLACLDGRDRLEDRVPGGRDVVGLADVERHRRAFALHE